jgi:hypothetical protein
MADRVTQAWLQARRVRELRQEGAGQADAAARSRCRAENGPTTDASYVVIIEGPLDDMAIDRCMARLAADLGVTFQAHKPPLHKSDCCIEAGLKRILPNGVLPWSGNLV